ncbi:LpqB family beta-propeller domain-containing protein [Asanoa sp. NPDC049518]|uniref:LpqB family beta-propeller domain-containing protein n=1 Tax=unclassified Asanoa TaxID=2685164 RepID=UPI003444C9E9
MSRRVGALVAAAGLAAGLLAGCGIPDHTDVQVDRAGPVSGADQQTSIALTPPKRTQATSVKEFVRNFLTAAAGEFDPGGTTSQRLQDYVAGDATRKPSLKDEVTVVRVTDIVVADDGRNVHVAVQQVGILNSAGEILAPTSTAEGYDLTVRSESGSEGGWRLTKVPDDVLLDVEALKSYYTERTVYFWNTDRTALVPDLRWLPSEVPLSRVPTELLAMIEGGPSPWLEGVALELPKDSKLLINAPIVNGQLTMNWSPPAVDRDAGGNYLLRQVAWTVSDLGTQSLQLKINGQLEDQFPVRDLIERTPYSIAPQPHAYAMLDHKIRALGSPAGIPAPVPLADPVNKDVRWAAVNRTSTGLDAAVVTTTNQLRMGSATGDSQVEALATVAGVTPTAPPVWLPRSRTGLVPTDGGLYAFGPGRKATKPADRGLNNVTSVAAALDGQRIAVIANGKLYVVPVSVMQDGQLSLGNPRLLSTPLADVSAVAWSGETAVSVSGKDSQGRMSIVDVSVDGARRTQRIYDGEGRIAMIAAYPEIKALGRSATILYQAQDLAWLAAGSSTQLVRSMVDDAPTASPGSGDTQPTAPFFVF